MSEEIRFVVFGRPQGKGSKRALPIGGKRGRQIILVDSNKNAGPWASRVAHAALLAVGDDHELLRGPVRVTLAFYFARPRGHFGTGRNAGRLKPSAPAHMTTMPDLDKLARCALDALTGTLVADDAQLCRLHLAKLYGEPERCEVKLSEVPDE